MPQTGTICVSDPFVDPDIIMLLTRDKLVLHFKAVWHTWRLDDSRADPLVSMKALRDLGEHSIPHLRRILSDTSHPEAQARSAVVLHWLGQRDGLPFLLDTLFYRNSVKNSDKDLRFAFLQIGVPDASIALAESLLRFNGLSDASVQSIRAFDLLKELHDPYTITITATVADRAPELFCSLCAAMGQDALEPLCAIAGSQRIQERLAAVMGLQQIGWPQPIEVYTKLLRDEDEAVRGCAAEAIMESAGPVSALMRIREAVVDGFLSPNAIEALSILKPADLESVLLSVMNDFVSDRVSDSCAAEVLTALNRLGAVSPATQETICALAETRKSPNFLIQTAGLLGLNKDQPLDSDEPASRALYEMLISEHDAVRSAAANAMIARNEPFGIAFCKLLVFSRPPESLLKNLQSVFVNAQDVGAAVSSAVGHVGSWITRVTREAAERYAPEESGWRDFDWILKDDRLPDLLVRQLVHCCEALDTPSPLSIKAAAETSACALKALGALEPASAANAIALMQKACLYSFNSGMRSRMSSIDPQDDALLIPMRLAAAQSLITLKYSDIFELLCTGLESITEGVVVTSAESLGILGDTRGIAVLQLASRRRFGAGASQAISDSIARIRKSNPDTMTLLRGSSPDGHHNGLLRPASENREQAAETLVRPALPTENSQNHLGL